MMKRREMRFIDQLSRSDLKMSIWTNSLSILSTTIARALTIWIFYLMLIHRSKKSKTNLHYIAIEIIHEHLNIIM
jgi:hypothetical protein